MKKLNLICALSIATLLTITANADNLVLNHSFNEGLPPPNEWAPADWNQAANPPGATAMGRIFNDSSDAGTNCQYLYVSEIGSGTNAQLEQSSIAIGEGTNVIYWSASYKILSSPTPSGNALIQVRAWDASGGFLGQDQFYPNNNGETLDVWYTEPRRTWTLPNNTDHLDVLADMGTWPWSEMSGKIYVDNFQIDFIPEPTLIFSGLLLGLAFLRRK